MFPSGVSSQIVTRFPDRYSRDALTQPPRRSQSAELPADPGLVAEDVQTGFVGAVVRCDKHGVTLEDRHGKLRSFPLGPGFWVDGKPVKLVRPVVPQSTTPVRTASGSVAVKNARARVAQSSRIYVEGKHDAELVEKVWGDDLRLEGIVVEELGGADDLAEIIGAFQPGPSRRLGVLLDHLVEGTKERRIADDAERRFGPDSVLIAGHPYVDIWQAVRPAGVGLESWPAVPMGIPWKEGVLEAIGWRLDVAAAWCRILGSVKTYTDLEPALLGRVEQLIDFVTSPHTVAG